MNHRDQKGIKTYFYKVPSSVISAYQEISGVQIWLSQELSRRTAEKLSIDYARFSKLFLMVIGQSAPQSMTYTHLNLDNTKNANA